MLGVGGSFAVVVADVLWGSLAEFGGGSLGRAAFLVLNGYVDEGGSCVQNTHPGEMEFFQFLVFSPFFGIFES